MYLQVAVTSHHVLVMSHHVISVRFYDKMDDVSYANVADDVVDGYVQKNVSRLIVYIALRV